MHIHSCPTTIRRRGEGGGGREGGEGGERREEGGGRAGGEGGGRREEWGGAGRREKGEEEEEGGGGGRSSHNTLKFLLKTHVYQLQAGAMQCPFTLWLPALTVALATIQQLPVTMHGRHQENQLSKKVLAILRGAKPAPGNKKGARLSPNK